MDNQTRNKTFLSVVDNNTRLEILNAIASDYQVSVEAISDELTDNDEAEHLLEYMKEPQRSATSVLMQKHGLRGF